MKRKIKKSTSSAVTPLLIILVSIICVFVVSRYVTYLILVRHILPPNFFLNIGGFRLHHFVYGNILITVTSFLAIGLGIRNHKNLFAVCYGIGLGLVLDEFLLWMGNVDQLLSNVMWIPYSLTIISAVALLIATIIMIKLYRLHKLHEHFKLR